MPRYLKQTDDNGCFPLALTNCLKSFDIPVSKKRDYKYFKHMVRTCKIGTVIEDDGSQYEMYDNWNKLLSFLYKVELKQAPICTLTEINYLLNKGYRLICDYGFKQKRKLYFHAFSIIGKVKNRYILNNFHSPEHFEVVSVECLQKSLNQQFTIRSRYRPIIRKARLWYIKRI